MVTVGPFLSRDGVDPTTTMGSPSPAPSQHSSPREAARISSLPSVEAQLDLVRAKRARSFDLGLPRQGFRVPPLGGGFSRPPNPVPTARGKSFRVPKTLKVFLFLGPGPSVPTSPKPVPRAPSYPSALGTPSGS